MRKYVPNVVFLYEFKVECVRPVAGRAATHHLSKLKYGKEEKEKRRRAGQHHLDHQHHDGTHTAGRSGHVCDHGYELQPLCTRKLYSGSAP